MQQQNKVRSDEVQKGAVARELMDEELAGVLGGAGGTTTSADPNSTNSNGADPNGNGLSPATGTPTDTSSQGLLGSLLGGSGNGLLGSLLGGDSNSSSANPLSILGF